MIHSVDGDPHCAVNDFRVIIKSMKFTVDYVVSKKRFCFYGDPQLLIFHALSDYAHAHSIPFGSKGDVNKINPTDIFVINPPTNHYPHSFGADTKVHYLFTSNSSDTHHLGNTLFKKRPHRTKVIYLDADTDEKGIVEKILWFTMLETSEPSIFIRTTPSPTISHLDIGVNKPKKRIIFRQKNFLILILLSQLAFIVPLIIGATTLYGAYLSYKSNDVAGSQNKIRRTKTAINITNILYSVAKPLASFLYLDSYIDNTITSLDLSQATLIKTMIAQENAMKFLHLITAPVSSQNNTEEIKLRLSTLRYQANQLEKNIDDLSNKISNLPIVSISSKNKIKTLSKSIHQFNLLFPILPTLLAEGQSRNYLIFFYNNMELRPGGGFLGSYAQINVSNYRIGKINIYDVYDADGQLKTHIEPPEAIRNHLFQPHWYLRDSNFSPDLKTNAEMAEVFLIKEMKDYKMADGFVAITTSAVAEILKSFPPIHLKDLNTTITHENFIVKSQEEVELQGSTDTKNKKNYLSLVTQNLILNIDKVSLNTLSKSLSDLLNDKQLVVYDKNSTVNRFFQTQGWSGNYFIPNCLGNSTCLVNYIAPIDANLGVNKTNHYVTRQIRVTNKISNPNSMETDVHVTFTNQSPLSVFPGGVYKNYFQLLIPVESQNIRVYIDGILSKNNVTKTKDDFTIVGQFLTVPIKQDSTILVSYKLTLPPDVNKYQLVVQKQIGSINNEMTVVLDNKNSRRKMKPQNFTALEKDDSLHYNTNLVSDKVFLIDF